MLMNEQGAALVSQMVMGSMILVAILATISSLMYFNRQVSTGQMHGEVDDLVFERIEYLRSRIQRDGGLYEFFRKESSTPSAFNPELLNDPIEAFKNRFDIDCTPSIDAAGQKICTELTVSNGRSYRLAFRLEPYRFTGVGYPREAVRYSYTGGVFLRDLGFVKLVVAVDDGGNTASRILSRERMAVIGP